eukprot:753143-Hanusia_phi.AAC.3
MRKRKSLSNGGGSEEGEEGEKRGKKEKTETKKRKRQEQPTAPKAIPKTESQVHGGDLHPFEHDPADDCETSFQAYCDIAPFLIKLAQRLGKQKKDLCIWDPYYCAGKVKEHLRKLGFCNVHNNNEDFYSLKPEQYPPYDVLLTSPPYSRNHIEKILAFASNCNKPWILLMPQYVITSYSSGSQSHTYIMHITEEEKIIRIHWVRDGKCPKGDECVFLHGEVDSSAQLPVTSKGVVPVTPFKSIWHMHFPPEGMNNGIYT